MSILIKGMEIPKSCGECIFNQFHEANPWTTWETCMMLDKNTDDIGEGRLADCPLVELPPHGRLIDADAFIEEYKDWVGGSMNDMICELNFAPTIVEASECQKK